MPGFHLFLFFIVLTRHLVWIGNQQIIMVYFTTILRTSYYLQLQSKQFPTKKASFKALQKRYKLRAEN